MLIKNDSLVVPCQDPNLRRVQRYSVVTRDSLHGGMGVRISSEKTPSEPYQELVLTRLEACMSASGQINEYKGT